MKRLVLFSVLVAALTFGVFNSTAQARGAFRGWPHLGHGGTFYGSFDARPYYGYGWNYGYGRGPFYYNGYSAPNVYGYESSDYGEGSVVVPGGGTYYISPNLDGYDGF